MIARILVWVIVVGLSILYIVLTFKRCETLLEKILCFVIYFVVLAPLVIFYLDVYNVPTILKWNENIDTQSWLSFVASYLSSIAGAVISAAVLIVVTIKQMDRTLRETQERDKEERRINNMPLIEYKFNTINSSTKNTYMLSTVYDSGVSCKINFFLKNIGMNSVKKCFINIKSNVVIEEELFEIDSQSCIYKEEEKKIKFIMILKGGHYVFNFNVYYMDLLGNWYKQKVQLTFDVFEDYLMNIRNLIFYVEEERMLKRKPGVVNKKIVLKKN